MGEEVVNKREPLDGLNDSLIKKDEDGESSEDEVEKEVSVEKEMTAEFAWPQEAAASPEVAVEVVQEVDFEAKYQRFLQNEEVEEREDTSTTGCPEEKEEDVAEKEEKKEADEADFCLMTDKPQEVLNAVPTLENTLGLAGADEKQCRDASSSSEDEEEGGKNDQDSDEDPEKAEMKEEKKTIEAEIGDNNTGEASFGIEVHSEIPVSQLDTSDLKVNEENLMV